jgi:alkylated DNA repair dioxygenase AlkB
VLTHQPSLLDQADHAVPDPGFGSLTRVTLSRGAWVDLAPGWVTGHEVLFDAVLEAADWAQWTRVLFDAEVLQPRLSVTWTDTGLPEGLGVLGEMAALLSARYDEPLTRISANLYRDGRDSVAWHGDTGLRDQRTATVAVVSLGHARPFRLRPRGGGPSLGWDLGRGDLAVMGGTCQRTWQHAVPKVAKAGPRICVMFRSVDAL